MQEEQIMPYDTDKHQFASSVFEEAFYDSGLKYSLRHLEFIGNISQEKIKEALQKSLQVCFLAGVNNEHHFKQIYVFDAEAKALYVDWLMSKNGFNLMLMQNTLINEKMARWLWALSEL